MLSEDVYVVIEKRQIYIGSRRISLFDFQVDPHGYSMIEAAEKVVELTIMNSGKRYAVRPRIDTQLRQMIDNM